MRIKSSRQKRITNRGKGTEKRGLPGNHLKRCLIPHGHDRETFGAHCEGASVRGRAVLTWLQPGVPASGRPHWANQNSPSLTIAQDTHHAAAAGPNSFDQRSLEWWVRRADCLVVDAGTKIVLDLYDHLTSLVKVHGATVFVVQTAEARRLVWHKYFQGLRTQCADTVVIDVMDDPVRGASFQLHRMGEIGDDFGPNGPSSPGSLKTMIEVIS
jgi:hypothetical protein